jgi:hypothetical protein
MVGFNLCSKYFYSKRNQDGFFLLIMIMKVSRHVVLCPKGTALLYFVRGACHKLQRTNENSRDSCEDRRVVAGDFFEILGRRLTVFTRRWKGSVCVWRLFLLLTLASTIVSLDPPRRFTLTLSACRGRRDCSLPTEVVMVGSLVEERNMVSNFVCVCGAREISLVKKFMHDTVFVLQRISGIPAGSRQRLSGIGEQPKSHLSLKLTLFS